MATIAENLTLLKSTKAGIKAAIEAKGVSNVGDKFSDYPAKIASIPTGSSSSSLRVKGLKFGYSSGGTEVQNAINAILGGPGVIVDLNSVLRDTSIDPLFLDLSKASLPTQIVDATGMCYLAKLADFKWPSKPSDGNAQLNATLMFSLCTGTLSLTWPDWIYVTDARDMFAGGYYSDLDLNNLDLRTNNISQAGPWSGGIFMNSTIEILSFETNFFNTSEDYNFSSLGNLQAFGTYNLQDGPEGWTSMVNAMIFWPHSSQTLILPVAWQEKIQQYDLESRLTSSWSSVTYQ